MHEYVHIVCEIAPSQELHLHCHFLAKIGFCFLLWSRVILQKRGYVTKRVRIVLVSEVGENRDAAVTCGCQLYHQMSATSGRVPRYGPPFYSGCLNECYFFLLFHRSMSLFWPTHNMEFQYLLLLRLSRNAWAWWILRGPWRLVFLHRETIKYKVKHQISLRSVSTAAARWWFQLAISGHSLQKRHYAYVMVCLHFFIVGFSGCAVRREGEGDVVVLGVLPRNLTV